MDSGLIKGYSKANSRVYIFILILLVLIGTYFRVWNLGLSSYWVDEVNSVFAAESLLENGDMALPSGMIYTRARLHTLITALFFYFFDINETTSRAVSAVFGILSIIMVYVLAKKIFNRKVGLMASFLVSFSHFEVGWCRVTRMYTLLQFLSIVIILLFIKGFEGESNKWNNLDLSNTKRGVLHNLFSFFRNKGISVSWIIVCIMCIGIVYFYVHSLIVFLAISLVLYLMTMTVITLFSKEDSRGEFYKYLFASILTVFAALVVWFLMPGIRELTTNYLSYIPPWAAGTSMAKNPLYLFEFLISPFKFPIAAFFFIGSIQALVRRDRLAIILICIFITPLFFLSFVFSHRSQTYIYYVYPFFLILASYGFVNIVEGEWNFLKNSLLFSKSKLLKSGLYLMFFTIFLISPWFRVVFHIPDSGDGVTNFAVTTDEWRKASEILKNNKKEDDLVISSLPQVLMFYKVKSDYTLNMAALKRSERNDFKDSIGRWRDVYSGTVCIESLDELKKIIENNAAGWIAVSKYHLEHDNYIPEDVREFLMEFFKDYIKTNRGTIFIFHWS